MDIYSVCIFTHKTCTAMPAMLLVSMLLTTISCKVNKRILSYLMYSCIPCKFIPLHLQPANGQLLMSLSYMRVLPVDVDEIDKFDCTYLSCYIATLRDLHCYSALLALLLSKFSWHALARTDMHLSAVFTMLLSSIYIVTLE